MDEGRRQGELERGQGLGILKLLSRFVSFVLN